jgi:hypothetical protein
MKSRFLLTRVGDSCFFQAVDSRVLADKNNKKLMPGMPDFSVEASAMATNDPISLFLSDHTEEPEQPGTRKAWDRADISSRILKTSILVVTAVAIVFAILSLGNPLVLIANVTASLVATSAPNDGTGRSTPIIQSTAGAQALPPTAREAPTGDEIAAASQSQTENPQPPAEALFKQFQAWAAEEDAQARPVQPVQDAQPQVQDAQPQVQDDQAEVVNAQAEVRPVKNARAHVRSEHNARAKLRSLKNARAQMRREQNARVQVRPVQNTQTQVQPVQNAQPPWLLQSLGLMN